MCAPTFASEWGRPQPLGTGKRLESGGMGTPQGAPISPLLSNIYMRRFVKGWKTRA